MRETDEGKQPERLAVRSRVKSEEQRRDRREPTERQEYPLGTDVIRKPGREEQRDGEPDEKTGLYESRLGRGHVPGTGQRRQRRRVGHIDEVEEEAAETKRGEPGPLASWSTSGDSLIHGIANMIGPNSTTSARTTGNHLDRHPPMYDPFTKRMT